MVDHIFLTVYCQFKLKLLAKVEFAKLKKNFQLLLALDQGKNIEKSVVESTNKKIKTTDLMRISQIHQDILNEDIRKFLIKSFFPYKFVIKGKIFRKKKEKMMKMCGGINKIQNNIKTIIEFQPEKKAADRLLKRVI